MKKAAFALAVLFCTGLLMSSCKRKEHCDAYGRTQIQQKHHRR